MFCFKGEIEDCDVFRGWNRRPGNNWTEHVACLKDEVQDQEMTGFKTGQLLDEIKQSTVLPPLWERYCSCVLLTFEYPETIIYL